MPTPPKPPLKVYPYMTVIPGRRPEVKLHTNIGQGKNAMRQYPKWNARGYGQQNDSIRMEEVVDGIRTGRTKRSGAQNCGGQLWEQDASAEDGWKLLYEFEPYTYDHQIPWLAKEFEGYVEPGVDFD
jgi:hypothetical protein